MKKIALLMLIGLLGGCTTSLTEQKPSDQLSSKLDAKDLDLLLANAQLQNHAALKRFEDSLAKLDASYVQRFDLAANDIADKAAEKKVILSTVYYLAKDKVRDTGETDIYLNQTLGPIHKPLIDTYAGDVKGLAANLDNELSTIYLEFATKIMVTESNAISDTRTELKSVNSRVELDKVLHDLGYTSSQILLTDTIRANSLVNKYLANLLKPSASKIFSSLLRRVAASVVVDPAFPPIGAILSTVGFLWSAYDMHQLQPRYRENVLAAAKDTLKSIRGSLNDEAKTYANKATLALDQLQAEMRRKAISL